jgi:hypothetical protein
MLDTSALLLSLAVSLLGADQPASLVRNGGLEASVAWNLARATLEPTGNPGRCISCNDHGGATQEVLVARRELTLTVAVDAKVEGVQPEPGKRGYAFAAVYQTDELGNLVRSHDFIQEIGTATWQRKSYTFTVDPKADFVSLRCGLFQATGKAWFDNWTLVAGPESKRLDEVQEPRCRPNSPKGVAAILDEPGMPIHGTASSPETIARILSGAGLETRRLSAVELADPTVLNPTRFHLVVVPTGQTFPAAARLTFREFLRSGGGLITMGGYAFNQQVRKVDDQWLAEEGLVQTQLEQAMAADRSLLPNGGFEKEQTLRPGAPDVSGQWHGASGRCAMVAEAAKEGRFGAQVTVPDGATDGGSQLVAEVPVKPRTTYQLSGWMRTSSVSGPGMAYMALYQFDAKGKLVAFRDFATARGTTDWQPYTFIVTPEPSAARLSIRLGLYQAQGTAWFDDIRLGDITGLEFRPMNTATGQPGDGLVTTPDQMGLFDASYPLRRACLVRTSPEQHVLREPVKLSGDWQGWAASGVVGYDNARWIPLLDACDRYGRTRGPAAAMLLHYKGYYAGSCWAYFGVENADLFADPQGPMAHALQEVARFMVRGAFLHNLTTSRRLYHAEEAPAASVLVENRSLQRQRGRVDFTIREADSSRVLATVSQAFDVGSEAGGLVEAAFPKLNTKASLCQVTAQLRLDEAIGDEMTSGFVVGRPTTLQSGPELRFADSYFTLRGRPMFLFGSDAYSLTYKSAAENPLVWSQELVAARDIGLNLYENLQYTNPDHRMTEDDWRAFRAMSQLTQQTGLVFMPGMLIGHNVVTSDDELDRQSALCREYARQLGDTPALLYYINGDYVLRPEDQRQAVNVLWNRWLSSEYGTTQRLRTAWGSAAVKGELGSLEYPPPNPGRWDDVAAIDTFRFRNWMMVRWNQAHVKAVREIDQKHPITSEYYSHPFGGIDLVLSIDGQDVSNIGYFDRPGDDIERLPLKIRWNDLRARGRGVSLGEYGVKTHPAWAESRGGRGYHIMRSEEEQKQLFLAVAHYTLGLGGSKIQNWCLRDADDHVFPWGFFYPNQLVPKDAAYAHRNQSIVWRYFSPVYTPEKLVVCLANQLRQGNNEALGTTVGYRTIADLLALHYPFQTIDDDHLDQLPSTAQAMIYPAPFALRDETYGRLRDWVQAGGALLVTGDFSYDANRKRTQAARLRQLAGVEFVEANYENVARGSGRDVAATFSLSGLEPQTVRPCIRVKPVDAQVLGTSAGGEPVLFRKSLGRGAVWFFTDPVELADGEQPATTRRQLYSAFLQATGKTAPLALTPNEPWVHVIQQPTAKGMIHVLYNTKTAAGTEDVRLPTSAGTVALKTRNRWPALAAVSREGKLVAVNALQATVGEEPVMRAGGLTAVLSLDGRDLRQSEAMLIAPFDQGLVELSRRPGQFVAVVGEFRAGKWTVLEQLPLDQGRLTVELDQDRATCVILVCQQGQQATWGAALTHAMLRPEEVVGY